MSLAHSRVYSGHEIGRVVGALSPVLQNEEYGLAITALLSLAIVIQDPGISADDLAKGVKGSCEYIALYLSSLEAQPPNKVN